MQVPPQRQAQEAKPENTLPVSPVAEQLRRGFRWLLFSPELENAYWTDWYQRRVVTLRVSLGITILLVLAFAQLSRRVMPEDSQAAMNLVRYAALIPALVLALTVTFLQDGRRWYGRTITLLAPVALCAVVVLVAIAWSHGEERLFSALILATFASYLLIGLSFYAALAANLIALGAYVYTASAVAMPAAETAYNALVLVAASLIGGAVAYGADRMRRREWLEGQLLVEMAERDGLTGIANRRRFDRQLSYLWAHGVREQRPLALLLADIDCFKAYNDQYGHQAGDEVLRAVAAVLAGLARRPGDVAARYGGEEFALILPETARDGAVQVAERLMEDVRRLAIPHARSTAAPMLTISVGVGHVVPAARRSAAGLVQLADQALYAAKDAGRNQARLLTVEHEQLQTGYFRRHVADGDRGS